MDALHITPLTELDTSPSVFDTSLSIFDSIQLFPPTESNTHPAFFDTPLSFLDTSPSFFDIFLSVFDFFYLILLTSGRWFNMLSGGMGSGQSFPLETGGIALCPNVWHWDCMQ